MATARRIAIIKLPVQLSAVSYQLSAGVLEVDPLSTSLIAES
jgi:hypothetical protein